MRLAALAASLLVAVPAVVEVVAALRARRSHIGAAPGPPQPPTDNRAAARALRRVRGRSIEQLAADLRRLRATVASDAHRSAARQLGDRMAYDTVLAQLCDMLEIPHDLGAGIAGVDRDIERVRVEAELERAGVVLSTSGSGYGV